MKRCSMRRVIFPVFVLGSAILIQGSALPALAGLTYTCDPNIDAKVAGTCAWLNGTIAALYTNTFSNVNANIYIQYGNTGLGQSTTGFDNQVTYAAYLAALTANAQASGNAVQVAAVNALKSFDTALYGTGMVDIPSALGTALGFTGLFGISADGTTFCTTPGTASCYNGIITITNNPGTLLFYRTGTEPRIAFDFFSTVEHETDEILGTISCIGTTGSSLANTCPGTNTPAAVDLYRYQSAGNLVLISTTPGAYFSWNGGQTNGANGNVYNTLANGNDYGDFVSTCQSKPSVQDAVVCAGTDSGLDITNDGGAEINILNAIGYVSLRASTLKVAIFENGYWFIDSNNNHKYDGPPGDSEIGWGFAGVTPVAGDWNGSGSTKVGLYYQGFWYLDYNGDGIFEPGIDKVYYFGNANCTPIVGDWNGSGTTKIGIYCGGSFILDNNGDGIYEAGTDEYFGFGPTSEAQPLVGDWNHSGTSKVGVFQNGFFSLDINGDRSFVKLVGWGQANGIPVVGDWNGSGSTKIGSYSPGGNNPYPGSPGVGQFVLDVNGDYTYEPGEDALFPWGDTNSIPVVGDWNGDGRSKIGVVSNGIWVLDMNGNFMYDLPAEAPFQFGGCGAAMYPCGQIPVPARWQ